MTAEFPPVVRLAGFGLTDIKFPEAQRAWSPIRVTEQQGTEVNAVEDALGKWRAGDRTDCWQQIAGAGRQITAERPGNSRGPFKDTWNQESSLIECAFHAAMGASQRGFRWSAIVAAIEDERVIPQPSVLQVFSQPADCAIHSCDFRIAFPEHFSLRAPHLIAGFNGSQPHGFCISGWQIVIQSQILRQPNIGFVGRTEPDHSQKRLLRPFRRINKSNGFVNEDL